MEIKDIYRELLAGIVIAIGGVGYLSVEGKVLGAFIFSIGLLAVLVFKFTLYTGQVCFRSNFKSFLNVVSLIETFLCNIVAAILIGIFVGRALVEDRAIKVVASKLAESPVEIFVKSILCGVCVAIAVRGYKKTNNMFIVVIAVMTFILSGGEHVIANFFYFSAGTPGLTKEIAMFLLINFLGNTIGGLILSEAD